ncbi:MAG: glycosyl hydrolase family 28 protein [Lachnospiraceae bacterium]|nr:glycosyl hydrolase family 28 protein [Lachnospiraceae bacterium]
MEKNIHDYDYPTYPQLGKIYPGDYYENIPYQDYIDQNQTLPSGESVFDIREFGALPERGFLNTEAFHLAAKACEEAGGGTILVAGGSYRMGTVWIPSNTTLFIASDSEIEASRNADLLLAVNPDGLQNYGMESSEGAFVRVRDAENVRITGGGRISGSGEWYVHEPRELPALEPFPVTRLPRRDQAAEINVVPGTIRYYYRQRIRYAEDKYSEGKENLRRPSYMVWIQNSSHVRLDNIILHDSMTWTLHADCCRDVEIQNLVIDDNRHVANTDGIDITGCQDVRIEHCFISCADDGICLKNPQHTNRTLERVYVKDCVVLSVMNAFKIGTGTKHDIRDILVEDCIFCMPDIYPGSVSGISLESCDGTNLSHVTIRNITMDKVACPLYIVLNMRNENREPYTDEVGKNSYWGGSIDQVCIENIHAADAELPSILTGFVAYKKDGTKVRQAIHNITIYGFYDMYRDKFRMNSQNF